MFFLFFLFFKSTRTSSLSVVILKQSVSVIHTVQNVADSDSSPA